VNDSELQAVLERNEQVRQRQAQHAALTEERAKYEREGRLDRAAGVTAELERLEAEGPLEADVVNAVEARRRAEADANRRALVAALLKERDHYRIRGLDDRAAVVDAELARISAQAAAPAKRAEKRRPLRRRGGRTW
jgi:hypothetical protein